jgi:hypothetical protein
MMTASSPVPITSLVHVLPTKNTSELPPTNTIDAIAQAFA